MLPILTGALLALVVATFAGSTTVLVGFPLPPDSRRIGCIDGLRGYLALSVLVHHFVIWTQIARFGGTWSAPTVNALNNLGLGSVALFFMTTGLVFYPRILNGFRTTSWFATYTTRVFRIIPLVTTSVVIITLIIMARTGARPGLGFLKDAAKWITAWDQPPLLNYPESGRINAYVLWSLWYEWIFYLLVLPLSALAMDFVRGRLPSWTVPASLLLISLMLRHLAGLQKLHLHGLQNLPQYIPFFSIGMLAYEVQLSPSLRTLLQRRNIALLATFSLIAGMVTAPTPYATPQLCFLGFFFTAVSCGNSFAGVLRTKGALALGECSYSIYLLHGIILSLLFENCIWFVDKFTISYVFFCVLPLVALVIVCVTPLTYTLIERPMIAQGNRIARSLRRRKTGEETPPVGAAS
jgi:peptidoglycan/LPS O-acetylase OafA/YrhL